MLGGAGALLVLVLRPKGHVLSVVDRVVACEVAARLRLLVELKARLVHLPAMEANACRLAQAADDDFELEVVPLAEGTRCAGLLEHRELRAPELTRIHKPSKAIAPPLTLIHEPRGHL